MLSIITHLLFRTELLALGFIMEFQVPETMRALAIHRFSKPEDYDLATIRSPKITKPDEVLIKVHSASINPGELKLASG